MAAGIVEIRWNSLFDDDDLVDELEFVVTYLRMSKWGCEFS